MMTAATAGRGSIFVVAAIAIVTAAAIAATATTGVFDMGMPVFEFFFAGLSDGGDLHIEVQVESRKRVVRIDGGHASGHFGDLYHACSGNLGFSVF
jgi:hypothetical protein